MLPLDMLFGQYLLPSLPRPHPSSRSCIASGIERTPSWPGYTDPPGTLWCSRGSGTVAFGPSGGQRCGGLCWIGESQANGAGLLWDACARVWHRAARGIVNEDNIECSVCVMGACVSSPPRCQVQPRRGGDAELVRGGSPGPPQSQRLPSSQQDRHPGAFRRA